MKKILVLSDTHFRSEGFGAGLHRLLGSCDMIIHAGDYVSEKAEEELEAYGNFFGVSGNSDPQVLRERLGRIKIIGAEGKNIGVCHGDGNRPDAFENARDAFAGKDIDAVIYGHSHYPDIRNEGGILYINPGSASRPRRGSARTAAKLIISGGKLKASLIKLKE